MSFRCWPLAAAALFALAPDPAPAQEPDSFPRFRLEGVVVTTARGPVDRRLLPQRVDIVGEGEMRRSGAEDAAEALRATTPVDVITYPGLLTGVSIRGFRPQFTGPSTRTLVLVDGRPAGSSNLSLFAVQGLDRIEVMRGPGSALYGGSAMSGVINLVTRRSTGGIDGSVAGSYGSFAAFDGSARVGGELGAGFDFDLVTTARGQREGYRTGSNRTFGEEGLRKTAADGTTSVLPFVPADTLVSFSEFLALSGRARLGYALTTQWRVDLAADAFRSEGVQNPGDLNVVDFDPRSLKDVFRHSFDLTLEGSLATHSPTVRLFHARETVDYFDLPEAPHFVNFQTPTVTEGVQLQDRIDLGTHALTAGVDLTRAKALSRAFSGPAEPSAPYNPDTSIRSAAAFSQLRLHLLDARLTLIGGLRLDRLDLEVRETPHLTGYTPNSETHEVISPSAGIRFAPLPGLQLVGNVGRGFVTPDPFAIAGYTERRAGPDRQAVLVTRGNTDLRPETSFTWDGGVEIYQGPTGIEADLVYFHTNVRDRVASYLVSEGEGALTTSGDTILSTTSYRNVDASKIRGIEGRLTLPLGRPFELPVAVRLFSNGTRILRAEDLDRTTGESAPIFNVADWTIISGVDLEHVTGRASGRLAARYVGERFDSDYVAWWAPGTIEYPPYLVLDLSARLRFGDRYALELQVQNLADEDYFEVRGYNMPGRSFRLGVEAGSR